MTAYELKVKAVGKKKADVYDVVEFVSDNQWNHVKDEEDAPKEWGLKPR